MGLTSALLGAHVVLTDLPAVLPGLRRNGEVPIVLRIYEDALVPAEALMMRTLAHPCCSHFDHTSEATGLTGSSACHNHGWAFL